MSLTRRPFFFSSLSSQIISLPSKENFRDQEYFSVEKFPDHISSKSIFLQKYFFTKKSFSHVMYKILLNFYATPPHSPSLAPVLRKHTHAFSLGPSSSAFAFRYPSELTKKSFSPTSPDINRKTSSSGGFFIYVRPPRFERGTPKV